MAIPPPPMPPSDPRPEGSPAEVTPPDDVPAEAAPSEGTAAEGTPAGGTAPQGALVGLPVELPGGSPAEAAPSEGAIVAHPAGEPTPVEATPVEPTLAEPATAEPATAEPATAEPTTAEPAAAEPATAEPTTTEQTVPASEPPAPAPAPAPGFASPAAAGYPMAPAAGPAPQGAPASLPAPAPVPAPLPAPVPVPIPAPAPAPPAGPAPSPTGYYPQESFYAPGWAPGQEASPKRRGTSRAVLWSLIGVVGSALVAGIVVGALYLVQTRSIGKVTSATTVTTQQVRPGHCIRDLPDDGSVGRVTLVPCSEPHEAQALSTIALHFDSWPGQTEVQDQAFGACEMSSAQVDGGFRAVVWTPTARSWGQGDKQALCIAWLPGGQYTGSFEDGSVKLP